MSDEKRRLLRLQTKSSGSSQPYKTKRADITEKRGKRNLEAKVKNDSTENSEELKIQGSNRTDNDSLTGYQADTEENIPSFPRSGGGVSYDPDNKSYSFSHLDNPRRKPTEIKNAGTIELSSTSHGISRIIYYPRFLNITDSFEFYDIFMKSVNWIRPNIVIHGEEYPQPRMVAWFGPFPYSYSGVTLQPNEMSEDILKIKKLIEDKLVEENIDVKFNSVLLNQYRDGHDSVAWHSDDELSMGIDPTIASISLGEIRAFEMRRKPSQHGDEPPVEYVVKLKNGSLLIMDGVMQRDWQGLAKEVKNVELHNGGHLIYLHRVPKEQSRGPEAKAPRINLTFRTVHKIERHKAMRNRNTEDS